MLQARPVQALPSASLPLNSVPTSVRRPSCGLRPGAAGRGTRMRAVSRAAAASAAAGGAATARDEILVSPAWLAQNMSKEDVKVQLPIGPAVSDISASILTLLPKGLTPTTA